MIRLGIDEFVRNIKRNIPVIIQISGVLVLLVLIISIYEVQTRMGFSVMDYIDDTGVYVELSGDISNVDVLTNKLDKVNEILYARQSMGMAVVQKEKDKRDSFICSSYDENVVKYQPRLKSGVWYTEAEKEEGLINIVIAENNKGYDLGDILELACIEADGGEHYIKCRVVGTVYKDTMLFGINNTYTYLNPSYLDLFASVNDNEPEDDGMFGTLGDAYTNVYGVMSQEDMINSRIWSRIGKVYIDFEDDITEEELQANLKKLPTTGMAQTSKLMAENSRIILFQKIGGIMILLIVLIALSIISIVSSSEVNFIYERRNYGIYFITGNSWKKTIILTVINWLCVLVFSVTLSITVIGGMFMSGMAEKITIIWSNSHITAYAIVSVMTMIIALIIPIALLRKSQPVEILKNV